MQNLSHGIQFRTFGMTGPTHAGALTQWPVAGHRRKFGMEFKLVLFFFQIHESYEIKFPAKISSFTVAYNYNRYIRIREKAKCLWTP